MYALAVGGVAGISMTGENVLRSLVEKSGGRIFYPARESELVSAAETIAADTQSVPHYVRPEPAKRRAVPQGGGAGA